MCAPNSHPIDPLHVLCRLDRCVLEIAVIEAAVKEFGVRIYLCMYEWKENKRKKSRRYKRVKRADELIQGLGSCVFRTQFCLRHFYCSFFGFGSVVCVVSAAEPKQRVKGLIHGRAFVCCAVLASQPLLGFKVLVSRIPQITKARRSWLSARGGPQPENSCTLRRKWSKCAQATRKLSASRRRTMRHCARTKRRFIIFLLEVFCFIERNWIIASDEEVAVHFFLYNRAHFRRNIGNRNVHCEMFNFFRGLCRWFFFSRAPSKKVFFSLFEISGRVQCRSAMWGK